MFAFALGLSSSICWGLADYLGGTQARRVPLATVMLVSQATGLVGVAIYAALSGEGAPGIVSLLPAAGGGAAGAAALTAFYRGLSIGTMSIVAPISATGAIVPVAVGIATGDRPGAIQIAGMALAVMGVVLASREARMEDSDAADSSRLSILLALVAALGFGSFFVGVHASAGHSVLWSLVAARSSAFVLLGAGAIALRKEVRMAPATALPLMLVGALDLTANALFAIASTKGLLSLVAVLGSLYPVATVLLARALLGERVRRVQEIGIVLALTGVALIAGGGA